MKKNQITRTQGAAYREWAWPRKISDWPLGRFGGGNRAVTLQKPDNEGSRPAEVRSTVVARQPRVTLRGNWPKKRRTLERGAGTPKNRSMRQIGSAPVSKLTDDVQRRTSCMEWRVRGAGTRKYGGNGKQRGPHGPQAKAVTTFYVGGTAGVEGDVKSSRIMARPRLLTLEAVGGGRPPSRPLYGQRVREGRWRAAEIRHVCKRGSANRESS